MLQQCISFSMRLRRAFSHIGLDVITITIFLSVIFNVRSAMANVVNVQVGLRNDSLGLFFTPNVLTQEVGGQVRFQFYPQNHSVGQSTFSSPCTPISNDTSQGFFSAFNPVSLDPSFLPTFTITVNTTDPIYFYCAQGKHCQSGMVGVINPRANETFDEFLQNAAAEPFSLSPGEMPPLLATPLPSVFQGTTINPATVTATNLPEKSSSASVGSSKKASVGTILGAVVGIVGLVAIIGIIVGLYVSRRRKRESMFGGPNPFAPLPSPPLRNAAIKETRRERLKRVVTRPMFDRNISLKEILEARKRK